MVFGDFCDDDNIYNFYDDGGHVIQFPCFSSVWKYTHFEFYSLILSTKKGPLNMDIGPTPPEQCPFKARPKSRRKCGMRCWISFPSQHTHHISLR